MKPIEIYLLYLLLDLLFQQFYIKKIFLVYFTDILGIPRELILFL